MNLELKVKPPTDSELKAVLGSAGVLWSDILHAVEDAISPLDIEWKPSKTEFGRICLLQHKNRTLLYLTPEKEKVRIAIVLGERACGLAMVSSLSAAIKKLFSEAKPYAEGRGIRFSVSSLSDISTIKKLVEIKTTPK
jgi:phosphoenolpyruvate synthase/pyruvate phosphate dikinase